MHMHTGRLRTRTNYYRSTDRYIDMHTGFCLAPHAAERSHASQYQRFKNVFFHSAEIRRYSQWKAHEPAEFVQTFLFL